MAGLVRLSLHCMLVMSLLYVESEAQDLNTCERTRPCLKYRESASCDSEGKRQVCFSINNAPECLLDNPVDNFCFANGGTVSTATLDKGTPEVCQNGVVAGQNVMIGIKDGTMLNVPFEKPLGGVLGYGGAAATCKGYEPVCGAAATEIKLTFMVTPCDGTTPEPTTPTTETPSTVTDATTKPTPAPCPKVCTPWVKVVPHTCTVTCGTGLEKYRRTCGTATYCHLEKYFQCTKDPCKTKVDGAYGPWGQWGPCSATCLPAQRTRTRLCNNPVPANGGMQCSGNASETQYSCPVITACPPPTAPPTQPPVTKGPGRLRRRRGRGRGGRRRGGRRSRRRGKGFRG